MLYKIPTMNQDREIGTKFTLLQKNNFKTGQHIWKDYFQDIGHQETMDSDLWVRRPKESLWWHQLTAWREFTKWERRELREREKEWRNPEIYKESSLST